MIRDSLTLIPLCNTQVVFVLTTERQADRLDREGLNERRI